MARGKLGNVIMTLNGHLPFSMDSWYNWTTELEGGSETEILDSTSEVPN